MTDAELIEFATDFRRGLLGRRSSRYRCATVSWPLASLLELNGVACAIACCKLSDEAHAVQHVWIELPDGRVLDATADQFNKRGQKRKYPPVYLGKPLLFHKGEQLLVEEAA